MIISAPHFFHLHWLKTFQRFQDSWDNLSSLISYPSPMQIFFPHWLLPVSRIYIFSLITRFGDIFSPLPMFCEILCDGQSLKPHKWTQEKAKKKKWSLLYSQVLERQSHLMPREGHMRGSANNVGSTKHVESKERLGKCFYWGSGWSTHEKMWGDLIGAFSCY